MSPTIEPPTAADPRLAGPAAGTYEGRPLADPTEPVFDQGFRFDLETLVGRRGVLKALGFGSLGAFLAACGAGASPSVSSSGAAATASSASAAATSATADCAVIDEETAGPYPGDGSNGPDVLDQSGVVRSDLRSSFGGSSGTAAGVPLTIKLALQDATNGCGPFAGAAVYLWHCDRDGRYSLYSPGVTDQNYLRGVQAAGSDGVVTFQSVFPACYSGRWPHIHFEVYPTLATVVDQANKIATSQVALPKDACDLVYATDGYSQSVANLAQVSLATDMVFGDDGGIHQLGTVTGSVADGMTVTLDVAVNG